MKLVIQRRNGNHYGNIEVPETATVRDLKDSFELQYRFYPERQRFSIEATVLADLDSPLSTYGITPASAPTTPLIFKDLGTQISWRLVFVIEYFGPLFIVPLFYFKPSWFFGEERVAAHLDLDHYSSVTKRVGGLLLMIHFLKRELESLFVHRFSNATMPIVRLPINCSHYWILCGLLISYSLFHPAYTAPSDHPAFNYTIAAIILVLEALNFHAHITLRNLRPTGTRARGIPKGFGFSVVSCVNYTWEISIWVLFSVLTGCLTSWLFTVVASAQMIQWALKKHHTYRKEFKDYPRQRRAVIPFLL